MGEREGGSVDLKSGVRVPFGMLFTAVVLILGVGGWAARQEAMIGGLKEDSVKLEAQNESLTSRVRMLELQVGRLRPWGDLSTGNIFTMPEGSAEEEQ